MMDKVILGEQHLNTEKQLKTIESGTEMMPGSISSDYRQQSVYIDSYDSFIALLAKIKTPDFTANELQDRFSKDFFQTKTVALCFNCYQLFESAVFKDGTLLLNYFPYGSNDVYPDTDYTYVVFDKDEVGELQIKETKYCDDSKKIAYDDLHVMSYGSDSDNIDEWINSTDELKKFIDAHSKDDDTINDLAARFDKTFFQTNKVLAFSYKGNIMDITATYDETYIMLDIAGSAKGSKKLVIAAMPKAVSDGREVLVLNSYQEVAVRKPVIYLYPQEETEVSVSLDVNGELTCVYPEFDDKDKNTWKVTAMPDGTLYTEDGSEYSYLFWEAEQNIDWDMSEGFVVKGCDTMKFLKEQLPKMGLTPKEYNDFIVFWLPLMQENEYNYITFQTDKYTDNAVLSVTPQADSVLRVFMAYMPVNADEAAKLKQTVKEPEFEKSERKGFTVVEWGGAELKR